MLYSSAAAIGHPLSLPPCRIYLHHPSIHLWSCSPIHLLNSLRLHFTQCSPVLFFHAALFFFYKSELALSPAVLFTLVVLFLRRFLYFTNRITRRSVALRNNWPTSRSTLGARLDNLISCRSRDCYRSVSEILFPLDRTPPVEARTRSTVWRIIHRKTI